MWCVDLVGAKKMMIWMYLKHGGTSPKETVVTILLNDDCSRSEGLIRAYWGKPGAWCCMNGLLPMQFSILVNTAYRELHSEVGADVDTLPYFQV